MKRPVQGRWRKTSFPHYKDMHVKQRPRIVFCHQLKWLFFGFAWLITLKIAENYGRHVREMYDSP